MPDKHSPSPGQTPALWQCRPQTHAMPQCSCRKGEPNSLQKLPPVQPDRASPQCEPMHHMGIILLKGAWDVSDLAPPDPEARPFACASVCHLLQASARGPQLYRTHGWLAGLCAGHSSSCPIFPRPCADLHKDSACRAKPLMLQDEGTLYFCGLSTGPLSFYTVPQGQPAQRDPCCS